MFIGINKEQQKLQYRSFSQRVKMTLKYIEKWW